MQKTFYIDGQTLSTKILQSIITSQRKIDLSEEAWIRVQKSRNIITEMMSDKDRIVYGINTGFGNFADKIISKDQRAQLQINLIRSHAVAVGNPIPLDIVRRMIILRINTLSKGRSGISPQNLKKYIEAYNNNYLPEIPEKGTVGASGDLAPLSHLALGLMGEGRAWNDEALNYTDASEIMKKKGLLPIQLSQKEGLALINGTQFMSSIISETERKSRKLIESAAIVFSFAIQIFGMEKELLSEETISFYENSSSSIGSMMKRVSNYLDKDLSDLHEHQMKNAQKNKTSYSLLLALEALASAEENINFCEKLINEQMNSATDNPLVYSKQDGFGQNQLISAGNFHGEYVAKASDYLSMSLFGIGRLSQARIQRYSNERISNLPGFLVNKGGLNSGFMIAQYTSAALLSESKVLIRPASTDSISTSASQEDHVSMGGYAARKSQQILENMGFIVGIQLMHCLQAIDLIKKEPSLKLKEIYVKVRKQISFMEEDRYFGPEITIAKDLVMKGLDMI